MLICLLSASRWIDHHTLLNYAYSGSESMIKGCPMWQETHTCHMLKNPLMWPKVGRMSYAPRIGPTLTLLIDGQLARVTCNVITWTKGWPSTQLVSSSKKQ